MIHESVAQQQRTVLLAENKVCNMGITRETYCSSNEEVPEKSVQGLPKPSCGQFDGPDTAFSNSRCSEQPPQAPPVDKMAAETGHEVAFVGGRGLKHPVRAPQVEKSIAVRSFQQQRETTAASNVTRTSRIDGHSSIVVDDERYESSRRHSSTPLASRSQQTWSINSRDFAARHGTERYTPSSCRKRTRDNEYAHHQTEDGYQRDRPAPSDDSGSQSRNNVFRRRFTIPSWAGDLYRIGGKYESSNSFLPLRRIFDRTLNALACPFARIA
jgi:hypothetical protein